MGRIWIWNANGPNGYGMPMMYGGYGMPAYDYQYPQNPSNQNINETPEQYPQTYNVPYGYYGWHCPMMGY